MLRVLLSALVLLSCTVAYAQGALIHTDKGTVVLLPEQTITAHVPRVQPPACNTQCQLAWLADAIRYLRANPNLKVCSYQEPGVLWVRERTDSPGGRCWAVPYMPPRRTGWRR